MDPAGVVFVVMLVAVIFGASFVFISLSRSGKDGQ